MKKGNRLYLDHILDSFQKVIMYVENVRFEDFLKDEEKQDAVIRKIEVAGEATKRLDKSFRESNSHIPWRAIAGMRDKLIHDYFDVDLEVVWLTATNEIPALVSEIDAISDA